MGYGTVFTFKMNRSYQLFDKTMNDLSTPRSIPPFVIKATVAASLGGVLFGYDMGIISAALPMLTETFELSEKQEEMVVSFLYVGCCIGATFGGILCDKYGRKRMILLTDVVFIIGALVLFSANGFPVVLLGRIIIGAAVAISGIADVAYLHEISPMEYRGSVVSCNEACISLGFLVSYVIGYIMSITIPDQEAGWRYMFLIGSIMAFLQFVAMIFMPESPVWLKQKGRNRDAQYVLLQIYGDASAVGSVSFDEVEEVEQQKGPLSPTHNVERPSPQARTTTQNNWMTVQSSSPTARSSYASFEVSDTTNENIQQTQHTQRPSSTIEFLRYYYRQAIIAVFLSIMQQFCGHPNVLNFAPEIFAQIGFDSQEGRLASTLLVGVAKFATTCLVILKIEKIGRKFLLLSGMSVIALSLLMLTIAYMENDNVDGEHRIPLTGKIIATIGVFGVAVGYAMSFGPLVWLLVSELFPSSIRGRALGGSTVLTYLSASVVSYTFLSGQDIFGPSIPFAIYFVLTMLSIVFAHLSITETAEKTPDVIHAELECMWSSNSKVENEEFECDDETPPVQLNPIS